jgi:hypothetical protein
MVPATVVRAVAGAGVAPSLIIPIFGVTDPATGWIDFPLHSGNRRIWLNGDSGNDSNNGLTAATAKKTFPAAFVLYVTGHTGGDQLMIAGKQSTYYSDNNNSTGNGMQGRNPGISPTYPNAFLCYDPTDASNSAKYGKLLGSDKPLLFIDNTTSFWVPAFGMFGTSTDANLAVQGIDFTSRDQPATYIEYLGGATGNLHTGLCYQNCRFNGVRLIFGLGSGTPEDGVFGGNILVSKCSFYGAWDPSSNFSGLFVEATDGYHEQEVIGGHCGWRLGRCRDEPIATGGPDIFGHGRYFGSANRNGKSDFTVWFDNAVDGDNLRSNMVMNYSVHLNEPTVGTTGGFSASVSEAPLGVTIVRNTGLIMGGIDIKTDAFRGSAWGNQNTKPGSSISNYLLLANPKKGLINAPEIVGAQNNSDMIEQYLDMANITGFGYSDTLYSTGGTTPSRIHITWTNCKTDQLATGSGNSVSSSGDFPSPWTNVSSLVSAMGCSNIEQLYNMMLYRPDLPWARAMISAAFTAHAKTQPLGSVSPPSLTGITPDAIYTHDTTAPTLSSASGTSTGLYSVNVSVTTNEGNGRLFVVLTRTSTQPTFNCIIRGLDAASAPTADNGSVLVTSTGSKTISISGLSAGTTYYAHFVHEDVNGNISTPLSTASFATDPDLVAPTLSVPTGVGSGAHLATVGATTDEPGGTLYAVVTTSSTQPTKTQIKTGKDHTGATAPSSTSATVSASGVRTLAALGLTASTTYFAHMMHEDPSANQSNIVTSSSFTMKAGTLGSELLTNGTFSSNTAPPTLGTASTISGGLLHCVGEGWPCLWNSVVTAGHTYQVTLQYTITSPQANLRVVNGGVVQSIKPMGSTSGTFTMTFDEFVAVGTNITIEADGALFNADLDNVSCKEITA